MGAGTCCRALRHCVYCYCPAVDIVSTAGQYSVSQRRHPQQSTAHVQPWRSHHMTTPCQTWWPDAVSLSALVYLNCNEHVAVYNMTLKSSNVKRGFGYALNFFHRELNSSDVFFGFYSIICIVCYSPSQFKKLGLYSPLLMTNLFSKQSRSRLGLFSEPWVSVSVSVSSSRVWTTSLVVSYNRTHLKYTVRTDRTTCSIGHISKFNFQ